MNRLEERFKQLKEENKQAFIAYIMAGENGTDETIRQMVLLEKMGADVIELGIPFSDPVADGEIISMAGKKALENGMNVSTILAMLKQARQKVTIPIVIMSYINPIYQYGFRDFVREGKEAGSDGLICPDVPFEESEEFISICDEYNFTYIQFLSLTSSTLRMKEIINKSKGFIYCVALTGVTGKVQRYEDEIYSTLNQIRSLTELPVCVGFGISSPVHVRGFKNYVDGVIVGSKIIELFNTKKENEIQELIQALREEKR